MYELYKLWRIDAPDAPPTYWAIGPSQVASFIVKNGVDVTEHLETGYSRIRWHRTEIEDIMSTTADGMSAKHLGAYDTLEECREKLLA